MNYMFACCGTGGHINPALAIASEIRRRDPDSKMLFVGADRNMEKHLIPRAGFDLVNIKMSGLIRGISPRNIVRNAATLKNLAFAGREAAKHISSFKPDAVVGTGGYISYPVLKKAAQMGIPTYIHESNASPGLATKMLSSTVTNVFVAFPGMESLYKRPERVIFTGTPVGAGFRDTHKESGTAAVNKKPLVVSFWGSLGAELMNEVMVGFISRNIADDSFDHIHATGKNGGAAKMMERLKQSGSQGELPQGIQIREYIDDMPSVMKNADIVLCRAGGMTIAELAALRKPSILVPSPYLPNDQQTKNAARICDAGGALAVKENECSGDALYTAVMTLLQDKERMDNMAASLGVLSANNAEEMIADIILKNNC